MCHGELIKINMIVKSQHGGSVRMGKKWKPQIPNLCNVEVACRERPKAREGWGVLMTFHNQDPTTLNECVIHHMALHYLCLFSKHKPTNKSLCHFCIIFFSLMIIFLFSIIYIKGLDLVYLWGFFCISGLYLHIFLSVF